MSKLLKGFVIAFAIVFAVAAVAGAQTTTTTTTVVASGYTYSGVMKAGMSGPGISTLQAALNEVNMGTTIVVDGKFGPATVAAVKKFQMSKGLTADGVVGPMTGAALTASTVAVITVPGGFPAGCTSNAGFSTTTGASCSVSMTLPAGCSSTVGYSSTTGMKCSSTSTSTPSNSGELEGEGSVEEIDVNDADDTDLNEGESEAELGSIEFTSKDGSVRIDRIDVIFDPETANDEQDPWKTFDSVSLVVDGDTIASMDTDSKDDWDETSTNDLYRVRFSGLDWVVGEDEDAEVWVVADIAASIDIDAAGEGWDIQFETTEGQADGIRYEDATGFVDSTGSTSVAEFTIEEAGGDSEFNVTEADDSPDASSLEVKSSSSSTHEIAVFKVDADEDGGDVKLNDFPVRITLGSAGSGKTFGDIIDEVYVVIDGDEYTADAMTSGESSTTANGSSTVTFNFDNIDDDDIVIDAGDEIEVTVKVKFKSQGASAANYANGTTVIAEALLTASDVEDADSGDSIGTLDGTATADTFTLFSTGISVDLTGGETPSVTVNQDGQNTKLTYNLVFKVTAFGNDIYLPKIVAETSNASAGLIYEVETSAGVVDTVQTDGASGSLQSSASEDSGYYRIDEGQTETFTVTVSITDAGTNGFYHVQLNAVQFDTDTSGALTSYTLSPENDFDTTDGELND